MCLWRRLHKSLLNTVIPKGSVWLLSFCWRRICFIQWYLLIRDQVTRASVWGLQRLPDAGDLSDSGPGLSSGRGLNDQWLRSCLITRGLTVRSCRSVLGQHAELYHAYRGGMSECLCVIGWMKNKSIPNRPSQYTWVWVCPAPSHRTYSWRSEVRRNHHPSSTSDLGFPLWFIWVQYLTALCHVCGLLCRLQYHLSTFSNQHSLFIETQPLLSFLISFRCVQKYTSVLWACLTSSNVFCPSSVCGALYDPTVCLSSTRGQCCITHPLFGSSFSKRSSFHDTRWKSALSQLSESVWVWGCNGTQLEETAAGVREAHFTNTRQDHEETGLTESPI